MWIKINDFSSCKNQKCAERGEVHWLACEKLQRHCATSKCAIPRQENVQMRGRIHLKTFQAWPFHPLYRFPSLLSCSSSPFRLLLPILYFDFTHQHTSHRKASHQSSALFVRSIFHNLLLLYPLPSFQARNFDTIWKGWRLYYTLHFHLRTCARGLQFQPFYRS